MGLLGQRKAQKRAQKYAIELLDLQTQKQKELNEHLGKQNWEYEQQSAQLNYDLGQQAADAQQQRNIDFYNLQQETEGLTAQFNEAQELGLNPLAFAGGGTGGGGGAGSGSTQGGSQGNQHGQVPEYLGILNAMTEAERAETESKLATAQIAKIGAETANVYADTKLKSEQTAKAGAEILDITQGIENKKIQYAAEEIQNRTRTIEANLAEYGERFNREKARTELTTMEYELNKVISEASILERQDTNEFRTNEIAIKRIYAEAALIEAQVQAAEQGIRLSQQDIELMKAEIKNLDTDTIIKQWEAQNYKANRLYNTGEKLLNTVIGGASLGRGIRGRK